MTENQTINIIQELQSGNEAGMSQLYDMYGANLYGLILKIVKNEELAQDILQDSFVKIWKNIHSFDSKKGSFFTWMLNICRNKSIDELRKNKNQTSFNHSIENSEGMFSSSESLNIDTIGLKDILLNLNEDQKTIIEYLYFKGYTQQETSEKLGIPLGTVKTRARMAINDLKNYFTLILSLWISKNI